LLIGLTVLFGLRWSIVRYGRSTIKNCLSPWLFGLRRRSTAARLLRLWVRIPPGAGMFGSVLFVFRQRSMRLADHSSRGVLTTVVRRRGRSRNFKNEETMARLGLQCRRKREIIKD